MSIPTNGRSLFPSGLKRGSRFYRFQSDIHPETWYEIYVAPEGIWCECGGYVYTFPCHHVNIVKEYEMALDEKRRLLLDKVFMAFGSQMHACEHNPLSEEWCKFRQEAWIWAIKNVGELMEFVFKESVPGDVEPHIARSHSPDTGKEEVSVYHTGQHPSEGAITEETDERKPTKTITVKEVKVLTKGTGRNGDWSLFGISGFVLDCASHVRFPHTITHKHEKPLPEKNS